MYLQKKLLILVVVINFMCASNMYGIVKDLCVGFKRLNVEAESLKIKAKTEITDQPSAVCIRDDAFSDSHHRTDGEASSGVQHDDRASSRNERQSPCEHTPEHRFGAALGR